MTRPCTTRLQIAKDTDKRECRDYPPTDNNLKSTCIGAQTASSTGLILHPGTKRHSNIQRHDGLGGMMMVKTGQYASDIAQ
ncbi:hypothetical protein H9L39_12032 [Fusarium oxysporum f. sp. albedinis]|nr:hypothetical protein H9L39_12032 [Fusarium oxysporum f. sp. albedinis]